MGTETKVTMKCFSLLWVSFNKQINNLPIKRDQFLNSVIERETPKLAEAMVGKRLSKKANKYIHEQLGRLELTTVNIGIDRAVASALNDVVKQNHIVRDAFFNRLIAFLRSSDALLDYFGLPQTEDGSVLKSYVNIAKPVSPLKTLDDTFKDPLWYLHEAIKEIHETSLYLLDFPSPNMDGFACWLDDAAVPGTMANAQSRHEYEELTRQLGEFELDAFARVPPQAS